MKNKLNQALQELAVDGRSVRRQNNAKRLYDAAIRLANQSGYQSITADDICREADVGRATFFRIYKSKSGLLREFNRRLAEQTRTRIEKADHSAIDSLLIVADEIALAWQSGGAVLGPMISDYMKHPTAGMFHEPHQELFDLVTAIIKRGVEAGEFKTELQFDQLASMALTQISYVLAPEGLSNNKNMQQLARNVMEHFFYGSAVS